MRYTTRRRALCGPLAAAFALGLSLVSAAPSAAATLNITGGTPYALPGGYTGPGGPGHYSGVLNPGDTVQRNGALTLDSRAKVTFERVGRSEARYENWFAFEGVDLFNNHSTQPGPFQAWLNAGALPVSFRTEAPAGSFANGLTTGFHGSISWLLESPTVAWGLFNDSATVNQDYDDMAIRVTAAPIPLPAAAWLLVAGLGSLGLVARRRRAT